DIAQSALKLISVVLRERHDVTVRDSAVDVLLGKVKDDLTEPLYRHITFNFLRAVLDRKVQTAVVYDVLDYVGTVMITNEDNETRSLARGAFFHFIRDFPQKKARWAKQLQFIVANLEYEREGGRLSVMETVHLLLSKSADDFVQEVASTCFIPLVFRLANDDSEKCRQAAGELIKQVFKKADQERLQRFLTLLRGWTQQNGNVGVLSLGVEAFGFYLETLEDDSNPKADLDLLVKKIAEILGNLDKPAVVVVDSDLVNTSLRVMHVLVGKFPSRGLAKDTRDLWAGVRNGLLSSETPVQISAIKLLGLYLVDFASSSSGTTPRKGGVFLGSHGL
ncbi:MAG: hypothetical protein OK454_12535, partial [Thaumarchaeota archaeon]|nr:hypothetical protein [Nitrososphaerota archaeon]